MKNISDRQIILYNQQQRDDVFRHQQSTRSIKKREKSAFKIYHTCDISHSYFVICLFIIFLMSFFILLIQLTGPVRKLSQNRIDTGGGGSGAGKASLNSTGAQLPAISVSSNSNKRPSAPAVVVGSLAGAGSGKTATPVNASPSSCGSGASRAVKALFQSGGTAAQPPSPAMPATLSAEDVRRASAPPLAVSEGEDYLPGDSDSDRQSRPPRGGNANRNALGGGKTTAASAPVSKNVSLDLVGSNGRLEKSCSTFSQTRFGIIFWFCFKISVFKTNREMN